MLIRFCVPFASLRPSLPLSISSLLSFIFCPFPALLPLSISLSFRRLNRGSECCGCEWCGRRPHQSDSWSLWTAKTDNLRLVFPQIHSLFSGLWCRPHLPERILPHLPQLPEMIFPQLLPEEDPLHSSQSVEGGKVNCFWQGSLISRNCHPWSAASLVAASLDTHVFYDCIFLYPYSFPQHPSTLLELWDNFFDPLTAISLPRLLASLMCHLWFSGRLKTETESNDTIIFVSLQHDFVQLYKNYTKIIQKLYKNYTKTIQKLYKN